MTTTTHPVVSVVIDSEVHSAATAADAAVLLDLAVRSVNPVQIYSWDRPCQSSRENGIEEWPHQQLRASVEGQYAVLSLTIEPEDPDELDDPEVGTWETAGDDTTLRLLADLHSPRYYEPGRAVPVDQAKAAIWQFVYQPKRRPDAVRWQPGEYV